jgi:hypothetical protein
MAPRRPSNQPKPAPNAAISSRAKASRTVTDASSRREAAAIGSDPALALIGVHAIAEASAKGTAITIRAAVRREPTTQRG